MRCKTSTFLLKGPHMNRLINYVKFFVVEKIFNCKVRNSSVHVVSDYAFTKCQPQITPIFKFLDYCYILEYIHKWVCNTLKNFNFTCLSFKEGEASNFTVNVRIVIVMSSQSTIMPTPCPRSQQLCRHCVNVVVDYADKRISRISSQKQKVCKTVKPVHKGPWSFF